MRPAICWLCTAWAASAQSGGGGLAGSTSIFAPASTPANAIFSLSIFVISIMAAIFVIVGALLAIATVRFRARAGDSGREPAQVYGSTRIELAWTVIPVLIVLVLFVATARVIHAIQDAPKPQNAVEITVIGHQFWWEFRYPKFGVVTANEMHIPASGKARPTPAFLQLLSADTVHSFWVPELGGKMDLIPDRVNQMWMDPQRPGIYLGQCAQYCGTQHAKMLLRVSVDTPEEFASWIRAQQRAANRDPRVEAGRRVFATTSCVNCHAVAGEESATGRFGPDLTHLMSRATLASGAAKITPANLRLWIRKPDAIKPGSLMPAMQLREEDLESLVRYLETLQ